MESISFLPRQITLGHLLQASILGSLAVAFLYLIGNEIIRSRARISGLKSPKGWPLVGNLLDIWENAALKYQEWAKEYGDVYQVMLGNTAVVVVNSSAAAKTLFMSNSQALSSRPIAYTFHKIASSTSGLTIGTSPYDESLKKKKKAAAVALNRPAIQTYIPYLDIETKTFIRDLFNYGKAGKAAIDPLPMVQRLSLSLVTTINWGIRIPSFEDELFKEIVHVEEGLNKTRSTVGNPQDHIPLLRLNPRNEGSVKARDLRQRRDRYLAKLNQDLAEKVAKGTNKPCIQASVIKYKEVELNDTELAAFSLSVLGGGFETVSTTVQWTIAYLAQHPDIQDKAHEEIRRFQGSDEPLCDAADDQKCAYILAMAKEALRYFTVIPLALPRESIKDIEYNGVRIPTGSTVYMNAWACNYDPKLWSKPDAFIPERWLEKPDAPLFTFGLGYRMCAAHILATRELYIIFMRLLSSFRIEAPEKIKCDPRFDMVNPKDLIMSPKPYRALFVPRDEIRLGEALSSFE
ncbi:cytochrome P450 [Hypoxylon trugodes]|uniref:cytochrome P450 n=1 Tax=Hypoxylon trugodes TaxID=326681 RepID=UPI002193484E|nr:cytochrome P450 [Hypoxylon trugodes]KAI1390793.1 cytochrome P450 [Hypoxylon trugodes]